MTTHTVETTWVEELAFDGIQPGGELRLDVAENEDGSLAGFRPKPLMLTALANCTAFDVASLFKKMRAEPEAFKVYASGELTEEHPRFYHKVKIEFHFWGEDLKKEKLEKAIKLSEERYCGVMEMFRKFAELELEVIYH